jgi:hypothetical protein
MRRASEIRLGVLAVFTTCLLSSSGWAIDFTVFAVGPIETDAHLAGIGTDASDTLVAGAGVSGVWTVSSMGQFDLLIDPGVIPHAWDFAVDASGDLYIADSSSVKTVYHRDAFGTVSVFATFPELITEIEFDHDGNLIAVATLAGLLYTVSPSGEVSVLLAGLDFPQTVAVDSLGDIYTTIQDDNGSLIAIDPVGPIVTTVLTDLEDATTHGSGWLGAEFDSEDNLFMIGGGDVVIVDYALRVGSVHPPVGPIGITIAADDSIYLSSQSSNLILVPEPHPAWLWLAGLAGLAALPPRGGRRTVDRSWVAPARSMHPSSERGATSGARTTTAPGASAPGAVGHSIA